MNKLTATERIILEEGYRKAYKPAPQRAETGPVKASQARLSGLKKGQRVTPRRVVVRQSAPPGGIREGDLIQLLQENGIGRPSTYAQTVKVLLEHRYVHRTDQGELRPTERGRKACTYLVAAYPTIFTPRFTVQMEAQLDAIAANQISYREVMSGIWQRLQEEEDRT
jgi:DNA topoisomerase-1